MRKMETLAGLFNEIYYYVQKNPRKMGTENKKRKNWKRLENSKGNK